MKKFTLNFHHEGHEKHEEENFKMQFNFGFQFSRSFFVNFVLFVVKKSVVE